MNEREMRVSILIFLKRRRLEKFLVLLENFDLALRVKRRMNCFLKVKTKKQKGSKLEIRSSHSPWFEFIIKCK